MKRAVDMVYGYVLRGTGSAIYVRDLCRALNAEGIDVVLFSQESRPEEFDFIARAYEVHNGLLENLFQRETLLSGKTIHVRPDLRGFLPVYVYDTYEGYETVAEFSRLMDFELSGYLERIEEALAGARSHLGYTPAGCIVHHLFPLPIAVGRAWPDTARVIVFHGSDLNFALRKRPDFEQLFARDIGQRDTVVTLTKHGADEVASYCAQVGCSPRVTVVPPGIETEYFSLRARDEALSELARLIEEDSATERVENAARERTKLIERIVRAFRTGPNSEQFKAAFASLETIESSRVVEPHLAAISRDSGDEPLIVYAGKYLRTKGIQSLLLAAPFVASRFPEARILLAGFGGERAYFEALREAIAERDVSCALAWARALEVEGNQERAEEGRLHPAATAFLERLLQDRDKRRAYASIVDQDFMRSRISFVGYLDHRRLGLLLSAADVFVAPSQFPESFGLVAIEAAACGATPVVTAESGFGDTREALAREVDALRAIRIVRWTQTFVEDLGQAILDALALPTRDFSYRASLAKAVERTFSWRAAVGSYRKLLRLE